jgi:hypothetical protein
LLNGNAALSADMAVRLEKSFGADRQKLLDIQAATDRAKQRETDKVVAVRRYVPNFLSIKALQIEAWAEAHLNSRQLLPVLLRRLVHSTSHDLRRVDFPGYDNAERKGSDGIIESDAARAWIPGGKSYWEFGVNKNPHAKAEKDYTARAVSVPAAERSQSTFVFVTPHNWPGKEAWLKDKNALNEWKAVKVLDASDLEQIRSTRQPIRAGQQWCAGRRYERAQADAPLKRGKLEIKPKILSMKSSAMSSNISMPAVEANSTRFPLEGSFPKNDSFA